MLIDAGVIHPTLLVGSFPYATTAETFAASGPGLAGFAKRLTDGEPQGWTVFAARTIPGAPGIEPDDAWMNLPNRRVQRYRVGDGMTTGGMRFEAAGYADIVARSYELFKTLRDAGTIAHGTRLQQSMPTPLGVVAQHFRSEDVATVFPAFAAAQFADLENVLQCVEHADFSVQWDVAVEIITSIEAQDPVLARLYPLGAVAQLVADAVGRVPAGVETGIHLCYGNPGGRHIIEPRDLGNLVSLANAVAARVKRPLTWVHMPVPIDRDDDAYFAPLRNLELAPETELYLGLVHLGDGVEGGRRRIEAAQRVRESFGIGTECGFRYVAVDDVPRLLQLHRDLARI